MERDTHQRLMDVLDNVPLASAPEGRDILLEGIPKHIVTSFFRFPNSKIIDLNKLVEQLEPLGQLEDGARPLLIFLGNAQRSVAGTTVGRILQDIIYEVERPLDEEVPFLSPYTSLLPETPETLIFGGSDERLSYDFFEGALRVQKSIVRLQVPRVFKNMPDGKAGLGTGWLVTQQLVFTNHHVVAARKPNEAAATPAELRMQAEQTVGWFDYLTEAGTQAECQSIELVCSNPKLDYALLRLKNTPVLAIRSPLRIAQHPVLRQADRLNIVQHPGGGPLKYAIRNNFYVGQGEGPNFIRYLTDTEKGSSGSPIFDDDWFVVAMHRAARKIPPESYKGETIKYHNEGIEISAILNDLPKDIWQEIGEAQKW